MKSSTEQNTIEEFNLLAVSLNSFSLMQSNAADSIGWDNERRPKYGHWRGVYGKIRQYPYLGKHAAVGFLEVGVPDDLKKMGQTIRSRGKSLCPSSDYVLEAPTHVVVLDLRNWNYPYLVKVI